MTVQIPDFRERARQKQATCEDRDLMLKAPLERVLVDAPSWIGRHFWKGWRLFTRSECGDSLGGRLSGSPPWWIHPVVDREVQRDQPERREMALYRSLHTFLKFRGFSTPRHQFGPEKCRVLYCPESDRGRLAHQECRRSGHVLEAGIQAHMAFFRKDQTCGLTGSGGFAPRRRAG